MSLSNISLPGSVIADLYKDKLVQAGSGEETAPVAINKTATTANNYKFLGNNQQQITIIVDYEQEAFIPDKHLQFLTKMLEACKLNLGDVAIVNHAKKAIGKKRKRDY